MGFYLKGQCTAACLLTCRGPSGAALPPYEQTAFCPAAWCMLLPKGPLGWPAWWHAALDRPEVASWLQRCITGAPCLNVLPLSIRTTHFTLSRVRHRAATSRPTAVKGRPKRPHSSCLLPGLVTGPDMHALASFPESTPEGLLLPPYRRPPQLLL